MLVYTGIDWSESKHDIVFMNEAGAAIAQLTVPHTLEGFLKLDAARATLGVSPGDCVVGLETAHNLRPALSRGTEPVSGKVVRARTSAMRSCWRKYCVPTAAGYNLGSLIRCSLVRSGPR